MKRIFSALLCAFTGVICYAQPYKNADLPAADRAADLVSRLTLEQKVALMQNGSPAIPEFGIKAYDWWNEALHGVGRAGIATVFPQAIGMAASFDDALLLDVFTAVSDEARAKSAQYSENGGLRRYQGLTFWTPNVNIFRDPRWGRGQETYGEDPYLTSRMGVSVVNGLQGPAGSKYDKLHACAKHFAVHSGPEWNRHEFNAENIAPRDLRETYLPAFKALVQEADVKEVMCAYNRYEDEPCCGSNRLLQQIPFLDDLGNFLRDIGNTDFLACVLVELRRDIAMHHMSIDGILVKMAGKNHTEGGFVGGTFYNDEYDFFTRHWNLRRV